MKQILVTFTTLLLIPLAVLCAADKPTLGVPVSYELPTEGPLPRTYLVTLGIVEAKNPDWIVSQFACGVARTITAENGGKFSEVWDGLDDNFMPVPPGHYAVKGIFSPAQKWRVDGEWHAVTPKFAGGASPWLPSPDDWQQPEPFGGDPVGSPMRDVAVGPNRIAVFILPVPGERHEPADVRSQPAGRQRPVPACVQLGRRGRRVMRRN